MAENILDGKFYINIELNWMLIKSSIKVTLNKH